MLGFTMTLAFSAPGFGAPCMEGGVATFCEWPNVPGRDQWGCFRLDDDPASNPNGSSCEQLVFNCRYGGGIMFSGVTLTAANNWGLHSLCANLGGVRIDGSKYCYFTMGTNAGTCEEIIAGGAYTTEFQCTNSGGRVQANCTPPTFYCDWGVDGCLLIPNADAATPEECILKFGMPVEECSQSACPFVRFRTAASAPLSAFYTRGGISVNWNAGSDISKGTVSLVNIKGVTVASTSVNANNGSIGAKLGLKSALPAGMYFVRVNALGVNGRQIVRQVPVNIVK